MQIDQDLISLIKMGDRVAFTAFYSKYYQKLLVQVLFLTNDEELAEDITQETFIRIWEKREALDETLSLKSFTWQIARNLVFDHSRKVQTKQSHLKVLQNTKVVEEETMNRVIHKELESILTEAINQLSAEKQTMLRLSRFEDMTYSEIAADMQTTPKAVERHMAKSLRFIRSYLLKRASYFIPTQLLIWVSAY